MKKILVVDDEVQIRELMKKVLSAEGYQATTVPSAEQALGVLLKEMFDVIILDINLAGTSGLAVLCEIRKSNSKIPVVIYSGAVTADIEKEAMTAGATEVLRKDIGVSLLVMQINKIVHAQDRITERLYLKKDAPILIVDDNENIRRLLKTFLLEKGYPVLEAQNGQEALAQAQANKIAVVLLDIEMPVMDGLETLPKLLEINPQLGIVMATGVLEDEKVKKAVELGAYGYILKPFDFLYLELVLMSRLAIAQGSVS